MFSYMTARKISKCGVFSGPYFDLFHAVSVFTEYRFFDICDVSMMFSMYCSKHQWKATAGMMLKLGSSVGIFILGILTP